MLIFFSPHLRSAPRIMLSHHHPFLPLYTCPYFPSTPFLSSPLLICFPPLSSPSLYTYHHIPSASIPSPLHTYLHFPCPSYLSSLSTFSPFLLSTLLSFSFLLHTHPLPSLPPILSRLYSYLPLFPVSFPPLHKCLSFTTLPIDISLPFMYVTLPQLSFHFNCPFTTTAPLSHLFPSLPKPVSSHNSFSSISVPHPICLHHICSPSMLFPPVLVHICSPLQYMNTQQ